MPHRKLFSPDDKMSDILQSNYGLLPLLPRFGLTLGVGEKPPGSSAGKKEWTAP